jgi:glycerol-3-phosphate O-acyltransferase/dihydroxyacetone phosphate acyltransferase
MVYQIIRALARLLLSLFYGRIEVVGGDHIPAREPAIIIANHHNSLVDSMLIMAAVRRPLVILAAAPLFRYPVIGSLMRLAGALPVLRRQEGIGDPGRNDAMFGAVTAALRRGGAVLLFPEGRTQPEPMLLPLRTGAARILLSSATAEAPVTLLPVGLVFHEPATFRTGSALVTVGPPVPTQDCMALYQSGPEQAVRELTERLTVALRQQIIEAGDRQTLRLLRLVETLWRGQAPASSAEASARVTAIRQVARAYRHLQERIPERLAALRRRLEVYSKDLERVGATDRDLSGSYPRGVVPRWALREGLSLLLGLPLAVCGIILHAVPYALTAGLVRALHPPAEDEATQKIVAGTVFYPLCWSMESWAAWTLAGWWALGALLVALLPAGLFALGWQERLRRVAGQTRAFFRFLVDRDLRQQLVARRQALVEETHGPREPRRRSGRRPWTRDRVDSSARRNRGGPLARPWPSSPTLNALLRGASSPVGATQASGGHRSGMISRLLRR